MSRIARVIMAACAALATLPGLAATIAPTSVNFGSVLVGTPAMQTVTVNAGVDPLTIDSVAITGAGAANFAAASHCGTFLAAGQSCAIDVTFTPTSRGLRTAQLIVSSDSPVPLTAVNLSGSGVAPVMTTSPSTLTFPATAVGQASAFLEVTIANAGDASLSVFSSENSPDFQISANPCSLLFPGASCKIQVIFTPTALGTRTGTLTISGNDPGNPSDAVSLSGFGADTTPDAFAFTDATSVPLGSVQTSNAVTITGINSPAPLTVSGGEYSIGCTGTFVTGNGNISGGQTVCVRHTASASYATATNTVLTVGGVSDSFTSTTMAIPQFTLTVAKAGSGNGTISGLGISCGLDCAETVDSGTAIALTASPDAGSSFAGWSGACSGTGACMVTMDAAKSVTATFNSLASIPRLANISTRMQVRTGNDVMIGGFVIGGSTPKTVVVRARGPSLAAFGITNALADPTLLLFSGDTVIASNDDFGTAANLAQLQASGFAPDNAKESAILTTLAPGAYTAVVSGVNSTTGVAIVEVFEVDHPEVPLVNISTRGQVLTGNDVMIGGFVIQGDSPQTVVIRARGPSLVPFGITNPLQNPVLQLFSGQVLISTNDDWQYGDNAVQLLASGFAPDPLESAILITLDPGAYTAIVTGAGGTTGVAIVEVFAQ